MNTTEEKIKSKLRELDEIVYDKEKYSTKERREALNKYYELRNLINDTEDEFNRVTVMAPESTPVGKPGPNRQRAIKKEFSQGGLGLLQEDASRLGYAEGTSEKEVKDMQENSYPLSHLGEKKSTVVEAINNPALQKELIEKHGLEPDGFLMELSLFEKQQMGKSERAVKKAEGGDVDEQMSMLMGPQQSTMMDEEMPMDEEPMESDSEMEDNYLDFIIDEALSEEEEDMLMSKLEQDEELSMLFDKVIEVASEFAGSGPVEGPGTGVSDSIPARLSDGEFVFTAKAVEEIGADNLMAMMKEAEMKADERQGLVVGGMPKSQQEMMDENRGILYGGRPQQMDVSEEIQKKMLDYPIIR